MKDSTRKDETTAVQTVEVEEDEPELQLQDVSASSEAVKSVTTAGVLAALSVAVAPIASVVPRLDWGIALFDPVSIFWIVAFLIGGIEVGLVCTLAGTFGLFFYDPTGVGPIFKLLATIPLIIVPWLFVRLRGQKTDGSMLSRGEIYLPLMLVAYLLRLAIMVPVNLTLIPLLFGVTDVNYIVTYTVLLNSVQTVWDVLVPYLVIHPTKVFESFGMW